MQITIIYSTPVTANNSEAVSDDDTKEVAGQVKQALEHHGAQVTCMGLTPASLTDILTIKAECIFNLIEWTGRDFTYTNKALRLLDKTKIPYTGSHRKTYTWTSNKLKMKEWFTKLNILTPPWKIYTSRERIIDLPFRFPVIIKPCYEHCSVGIDSNSVATSESDLRAKLTLKFKQLHQPLLVEEFIVGREIFVSMVETDLDILVLPLSEIVFDRADGLGHQTFHTKWTPNHPDHVASKIQIAALPPATVSDIKTTCVKIFRQMDFRGYARFDVRLDRQNHWYILETNANPNLWDETEPEGNIEVAAANMKFHECIWYIVSAAFKKNII